MSGLTANNLLVVCRVGAATRTSSARKRVLQHRQRHAATASWWSERNLIPPNIEAAGTPRKRCERESRRERPRQHREERSLATTPPLINYSASESEVLYDWRFPAYHFVFVPGLFLAKE
jgi:hypothetical protein